MPTAQPRTSPSDPGAAVGRRACLRSWPCGRLLQVLMVAEPVVTILLLRLMCSPGVVRRAGGPSAARPQPVPAAGPPAAGAGPFLPGRADQPGPVRTGRGRAQPRPARSIFRRRVHRGPDRLVPDLQLPAVPPGFSGWGVGEHTDYGLLTLLAQDDSGRLQIAAPEGWTDAPPVPGTFVANIGDVLDRLTGGWYQSTPHRVRNLSGRTRLSLPFFLDPGFANEVPPLPVRAAAGDDGGRRWDGQDLRAFTGT